MPYLALGILTGTALLVAVSYLRFRDALYPTVIHAGIWGTVLFLYCLSTESFLPLSDKTLFIFLSGMVAFAMGCYLATWNFKYSRCTSAMPPIPRTLFLDILFWVDLALLPVACIYAWQLARSGPTSSLLINLRMLESTGSSGTFIWNYLAVFSIICSGLKLLAIDIAKKRSGRLGFAVSVLVAIAYCVLNTGRSLFFLLLIFLGGIAIVSRKVGPRKVLIYTTASGLSVFVLLALILGKGGNLQASFADNISSLLDTFRIYLLGPLPTFDIFVRHHESLRLGDNVFRTLWAATDKLGLETPALPVVHEFVNVPYASNVYTVYRPYFDDFGLIGAVAVQFILGVIHGALYRKLGSLDPFWTCVFAFSLFALALQFFQDEYVTLASQWIQTAALLLILLRMPRSSGERRRSGPEPIPA